MNVSDQQMLAIEDLVGSPFVRGGRGPGGYDFLGLTLRGLEILRPDLRIVDPWRDLARKWQRGWRPAAGEHFPPGFTAVPADGAALEAADVLLVGDRESKALTHVDLVVWASLVLRTREKTGATLLRLNRIVDHRLGAWAIIGAMR